MTRLLKWIQSVNVSICAWIVISARCCARWNELFSTTVFAECALWLTWLRREIKTRVRTGLNRFHFLSQFSAWSLSFSSAYLARGLTSCVMPDILPHKSWRLITQPDRDSSPTMENISPEDRGIMFFRNSGACLQVLAALWDRRPTHYHFLKKTDLSCRKLRRNFQYGCRPLTKSKRK